VTWVKVCGLTHPQDVVAAVAAGADAIGFVAVPGSPRFVTLERAGELAAGASVRTVLLTVDLAPAEALDALRMTEIGGIQPYGRHAAEAAAAVLEEGFLVLFPQKARPQMTVAGPGIPLVDTPSRDALGGTGVTFDWQLVAAITERFVLAGGLGPQNIREVVRTVRPWGVDASSKLERTPGRKDHGMVADFITKAKDT
jgi:phosphoribosylanthranilate isomerase